jgi:hypothetical protein
VKRTIGRGTRRLAARRALLLATAVLCACLLAPAAANATITSVFGTVTCTEQGPGATAGQRWCGNSAGTTVASWDGTPIDVAVGFPVATGSDNNYPVVGIYHGWGGSKITPSSATAQRWLTKGYAVFSITDRGWGSSCGKPSSPVNTVKPAPCQKGYIHLMSRAYEVRDVQTLLGKLADEGVINPQVIGATGGSYGGGMSLQLGALKDRMELPNHELIPWESPLGKPMKIAATAPEFPWTDLSQALAPNGSTLDYVANAPYSGMLGNHRYGIEKAEWSGGLYSTGLSSGYYGPEADPEANLTGWHNFDIKGGPYDGEPLTIQQEQQLPFHSPYYANLSEPPAPSIMENGWNDDLFPVDETVKYYNKVRAAYPNEAMKLFDLDIGHNPRSATTLSTSDTAKFQTAQNEWFAFYLKGEGSEPAAAKGGVTAITAFCPQTAGGSGTEINAPNWASLAPGEITFSSAAEQTIQAPGTASANSFASPLSPATTICTTQASANNPSAAEYAMPAAPASGYTIAGSSTVIAEFATPAANDQVIARLYDVNGSNEQLIGRQAYRPLNPGEGFTKQTFQLHPQAWKVAAGHVVKLELLVGDQPTCPNIPTTIIPLCYARNSSSPHSVQVRNLELRVPTADLPGSAEGMVKAPQPHYLPPGYTLARNVVPAPPTTPSLTSGKNPNKDGQFTLSWESTQAATEPTYTLQHKNASGGWSTVASGLTSPSYTFTFLSPEGEGTWKYRVTESNESSESEPSGESEAIKVDKSAPNPPNVSADRAPDYAGGGGWFKDSVEVTFSSGGDPNLSDGSPGSGVNPATIPSPQTFNTNGSHEACGSEQDEVGNESSPACLTVQVDVSPPTLELTCPAKALVGESVSASFTASDGQSGLASEPSGTIPIDTSTAGKKTVGASAADNVGHEAFQECSTEVEYPTPGAPTLSAGTNPNANGLFTLSWTGADPLAYFGLTYTLEHHNAEGPPWSQVAGGIENIDYAFTGAGEAEGTWVYRVQGHDEGNSLTTEYSPESEAIKVDKTPPLPPTASADRAPDYAGGGGWYKNHVEVSFSSNGDPALADGSAGTGVNPASLPATQTYTENGSHNACGSLEDNVGNKSSPGCLKVQVESTPPNLEITCPTMVAIGTSGVHATVTASDSFSGLLTNPSGMVPINTSTSGLKTVTEKAVSNVGTEITKSCSTFVGYFVVIKGPVNAKLVVRKGEAVELAPGASVKGSVTVHAGGALDVEGATLGSLKAGSPALVRVCGATINGSLKVSKSAGALVIGDGTAECTGSMISGSAKVTSNMQGVTIDGNTFGSSLSVTGNMEGTTVIKNKVAGNLMVLRNSGTVLDTPNEVAGKSKLQ